MTTITVTAAAGRDRIDVPALRPLALRFIAAAVLWAIGDAIEIPFAKTDTPADGWSFFVDESFFYAAMILFVWALFSGVRRGLAGRSRLGAVGLVIAGACWILIMVGGVLMDVGFAPGGILLPIGGSVRGVGEILAGIGIVRCSAVRLPARWVFLIYAIVFAVTPFLGQLRGGDAGPGHLDELAQAALWALIGVTLLRDWAPRANRVFFALAIALAIFALATVGAPV